MSQASSPGRCCWPLSLIRCGGPSATRTRTAAKRALSFPFGSGAPSDVPPSGICQHLFSRHREDVRNVPLTGTAASGNRPDHLHIGRIYLQVPRDTDCPSKFASCEPLAERRSRPITGVRSDTAKEHTGRDGTTDFRQSHLRFRSCRSIFGRNTRSLQSSPLARPTLRKEQPQRQHDWYLASRKRQRYQCLAVGGLAQRRSILCSDTHRMRAFLGYCGVVDHQHGIAAADQPIRLNKQFRLHTPRIPDPGRNEVGKLIVFAKPKPLRHRLNALAIARTDQPRHVEWTHLSPRLVTQPIQKRLEKASKLFFPIRRPANHGRPLQKPTTYESQKN